MRIELYRNGSKTTFLLNFVEQSEISKNLVENFAFEL